MADATFYFPPDFLWGTATAAHQVEGSNTHNDWHHWEQAGGGRIYADQVSGDACGWWEGYAEKDIRRMKELHTNAHRLSVEWSRIEPSPGKWNIEAIDRYRAILATMIKAGIQPMVTLHHFTSPNWLAKRGGWLNEETPALFARFVKKTVGELSDLCHVWCTINEPGVYCAHGYFNGIWPPGQKNLSAYFRALHNLLAAHAAAYHVIHDLQPEAEVGLAHHMVSWYQRNRFNPLDRMIRNLLDRFFNGLVLDTISTGEFRPLTGGTVEMPRLIGTLDWIGLNYYQRFDASFSLRNLKQLGIAFAPRRGYPRGPKSWGEIYPHGLYENLMQLYRRFRLPIYITENGLPDEQDGNRPAFILEHLRQVWRVIQFNIPVKGYYFWSLVDNFEWREGYDPLFRFGLYGVDFRSQKRSLRKSGELYQEICAAGAISSDMARRYAPEIVARMFPG